MNEPTVVVIMPNGALPRFSAITCGNITMINDQGCTEETLDTAQRAHERASHRLEQATIESATTPIES